MQSVNGALFLIIVFFYYLVAATVPVFGAVMVPLTSIDAPLQSHKPDLNIEVLNLIGLLVLYVLHAS